MADWSTKSDSQIEFEVDAAEARGYARGKAEILAKVRALPSPWQGVTAGANPQKDGTMTPPLWHMHCRWCDVRATGASWRQPAHPPDSNCLWALAHAETPED